MADLAELRTRLEKLKSNRAAGVHRVGEEDQFVEYRRDSEIAAAITALEAEIARKEGRGSARSIVIRSNKGW